jgi:predicted DNA-binding helix-hairpin-helix protein
MVAIAKAPTTIDKLRILSQDSQYDLACACGTRDDEHRKRSIDNRWIYPVALPDGRHTFLFKTLVSNVCSNDCKYCPLRADRDPQRCMMNPDEIVAAFMQYYRAGLVSGLFLSSGVTGTPDTTMERINGAARILRNRVGFKGYMHLKIIPGASDAAIDEAVSLASAVSLNIETAGEKHFEKLTARKNYLNDVIRPIKRISTLTAKGTRYQRVSHTTQFVVGAAGETDKDLVKYMWGLYKKLKLDRIYFSAYQRGAGSSDLPGEAGLLTDNQLLTREHRLYQTDWLIRKYGFSINEIPFESGEFLSLEHDPKEMWARANPHAFPVNLNEADQWQLLRIPGIGLITVKRILKARETHSRIRSLDDLGLVGKRHAKARGYVCV